MATDRMDKREKIAKALEGRSVYREGSLSFSCLEIAFSVRAGESVEGSFLVTGQEGLPLMGTVLTGDVRMHCLLPHFNGNPVEVLYRFDSWGLDEGDLVRGEFKVISSQGEYTLPYVVRITPKIFETSLGQMKNLFHFANLARTSWQEAVRVFYDPDFAKILTGNDRQYLNVYRAFCRPPHKEQKVEEFLVWIRKKQLITYQPDREELLVSCPEDIAREVIVLTKSGWGYTNLSVEVEGEFLESEKSSLTDDDFLGNQCACPLLIFKHALHMGCNYGKVRFRNEYVSLEIPVYVNHADVAAGRGRLSRKKRILEFYRCYLLFGMGKMTRQDWLTEMEQIVQGMGAAEAGNPLPLLFRAHILLTRQRRSEAKGVLEQASAGIVPEETRPEISCYYLYLTSLVSRDENYIRAVTEEIRRVYYNDQTNWQAAWLLLYLDGEFARSLSRKWLFLEQQFEKGCRSPIWYMEAARMVRKHPAFLMKMTPFVMQTLNFMAKYDYLTNECISQIHYLAERVREYSERMYAILQVCYQKKKDPETLHAICSLLIKGNKIGPEYAHWYRKGIEKELWLTRLYEHYMLSVDIGREKEIPAAALRYFSYRSELPDERTAFLYAYIVRKSREYQELYRTCLPDMEKFLAAQLEMGHMSGDIARLYRRLIQEGFVGTEMLAQYASCLFIHEIRIVTPGIRRVIVIHGRLKGEITCQVVDGFAYVPVYDRDFSLVFEGDMGSRFVSSVDYEDNALFYPQEMLPVVAPGGEDIFAGQTGVMLYQCENGKSYTAVEEENAGYAIRLWESDEIEDAYRNELGMKLLQYYDRSEQTERLDQFLVQMQPQFMSRRERNEVIKCLLFRGMYDQILDWLRLYGPEKMTPKTVMRLCSRLLPYIEYMESPVMTALAWSAFCSGKYNDMILWYLAEHFEGTMRELQEIWDACTRFETDSGRLCGRLLLQMLFTNEYPANDMEIFRGYMGNPAQEQLTDACMVHFARRYVMDGREPTDFIWKELWRRAMHKDTEDVMCELALLEHLAGGRDVEEEEKQTAHKFLEDLVMNRGIVLGEFMKFAELYPGIRFYEGRGFVEYRSDSADALMLHAMLRSGEGKSEYRMEELPCCYPGIYATNFLLFPGESLEYYIMERNGEKETLVQSATLYGMTPGAGADKSRIARTVRFLDAVSQPDDSAPQAGNVLEEYLRTEFSAEKLFHLL